MFEKLLNFFVGRRHSALGIKEGKEYENVHVLFEF